MAVLYGCKHLCGLGWRFGGFNVAQMWSIFLGEKPLGVSGVGCTDIMWEMILFRLVMQKGAYLYLYTHPKLHDDLSEESPCLWIHFQQRLSPWPCMPGPAGLKWRRPHRSRVDADSFVWNTGCCDKNARFVQKQQSRMQWFSWDKRLTTGGFVLSLHGARRIVRFHRWYHWLTVGF